MAQEHSILEVRLDRTELINLKRLTPSSRPKQGSARTQVGNWPHLTGTEIRGVAELSRPAHVSLVPSKAHLRSDLSVMVEMETLRRDPAWRLEKLGQQTREVTWRSFDTAVELLREGVERGLTAALIGGRRLSEALSKAVHEAWQASRTMGRPNYAAFEPEIRTGKQSTLARPAVLRAKAAEDGLVVAKLSMGTQVFVLENFNAPDGYILVQTSEGEIGFLAR